MLLSFADIWRRVSGFLFADNFPFKYHKRDTKSPNNVFRSAWQKKETPSHRRTKAIIEKQNRLVAENENAKHNINTNLQSCNNFLAFFFRCSLYCLFSEFPHFWTLSFGVSSRFPYLDTDRTSWISRRLNSILKTMFQCRQIFFSLHNCLHAVAP